MQSQLILLFCFIICIKSDTYGCLVWQDSFIYYQNYSLPNITLNIYISPRSSWLGIKFYEHKSSQHPILYISSSLKNINFSEFNTNIYNLSNFQSEIDYSNFFKIDNILHFQVTLPSQLFEQFKYAHFCANQKGIEELNEIGKTGIKMMPLYDSKNNFLPTYCDPEYLKLAGRIGAQNIITYSIFLFGYLTCIVLSVYFRNDEPLRSREYGPILSSFFLAVDLTSDFLLTNAITYEQFYYADCYVSNFIIYPCGMGT